MKKLISLLLLTLTSIVVLLIFFYVILQHGTSKDNADTHVNEISSDNKAIQNDLQHIHQYDEKQTIARYLNTLSPQKPPLKTKSTLINNLAHNIEVNVQLNSSSTKNCHLLGSAGSLCYSSRIFLKNTGDFNITGSNWKLYLYSIRRILSVDDLHMNKYPSIYTLHNHLVDKSLDTSGLFKIKFITGGLYEISPTKRFKMFERLSTTVIDLVIEFQNISLSDIVPNWFFSVDGELAPVSNMTSPEKFNNYVINTSKIPYNVLPNNRYDINDKYSKKITNITKHGIIPTPKKISYNSETAPISLSNGVSLHISDLPQKSIDVIKKYLQEKNIPISDHGFPVYAHINSPMISQEYQHSESYTAHTTQQQSEIYGYDQQGLFYGLVSFIQSIDEKTSTILPSNIQDTPRYHQREQHLDVARHFHSIELVKKIIHEMAFLKLNALHLTIANDEGWRLEIPGIPELTDVGSRVCLDMTETKCLLPQLGIPLKDFNKTLYYTTDQYEDLIRYATAHFVKIIPELDLPAHERAAVVSMEARYKKYKDIDLTLANQYRLFDPQDDTKVLTVQYYGENSFVNPAVPGTANFLNKVIKEITNMHKNAGTPLDILHIGGDTVFNFMSTSLFTTKYEEKTKGLISNTLNKSPLSSSPQVKKVIGSYDSDAILSKFINSLSKSALKFDVKYIQAWSQDNKILNIYNESKGLRVNFWFGMSNNIQEQLLKVANQGAKIIMSQPDYTNFDFKYENNINERGYYWASNNNSVFKLLSYMPDNLPANAEIFGAKNGTPLKVAGHFKNPKIFGMSGQLWSETLHDDYDVEYMLYPRIVALAQKSWHKNTWEPEYVPLRVYETGKTHMIDKNAIYNSYDRFINILYYKLLPRYDKLHIIYRIPPPGGVINDNELAVNSEIPNLPLEYSFDKTIWVPYTKQVDIENRKTVYIRSSNHQGTRYGRIVVLKNKNPNYDDSLLKTHLGG